MYLQKLLPSADQGLVMSDETSVENRTSAWNYFVYNDDPGKFASNIFALISLAAGLASIAAVLYSFVM